MCYNKALASWGLCHTQMMFMGGVGVSLLNFEVPSWSLTTAQQPLPDAVDLNDAVGKSGTAWGCQILSPSSTHRHKLTWIWREMAKNHVCKAKITLVDRESVKSRLIVTWLQQKCCKLSYDSKLLNRTEWWLWKIIFFQCSLVWW